jgi:hypothetical protein
MANQTNDALRRSATGSINLPGANSDEYIKKRAAMEKKTLETLKGIRKSSETFTDEATTKGSIYVHDTHVEKKIDSMPGYSGTKDPADEQNWQTIPQELEAMLTAEDRVAKAMYEQKEAYGSSQDFSESAAKASVEGLKERGITSIEYEGGQMELSSAMEKANSQLDASARSRYMEDNQKELDALDKTISEMHKKVVDESKAHEGNKSIRDMPSYKALSDAHARKGQILSAETPEKYFKENTMMAAPGEDPNMLYEYREEAVERAKIQRAKNVESKQGVVAGLEKEMADIQSELANWDSSYKGLSPNERAEAVERKVGLEKRLGDIKGTSENRLPDWMTGGVQGTRGIVYEGELAAAKSNLEISKRELDPSTVERQVIGKNEWTGNSDTTVIFPEKYAEEAVDWQMRSGTRTVQNADGTSYQLHKPELMHPMSIEPEAKMVPGVRPTDAQHILSEGPDTEIQAFAERKIEGNTESAMNLAEEMAGMEAKARLIGKLGKEGVKDFSGIEVETDVDLQKKIVTAFASWSKEGEEAALKLKKSMEETNAAQGGAGRAGMFDPSKENYTTKVVHEETATENLIEKLRAEGIKSEKWTDAGAAGMVLSDRQYMEDKASKAAESSSIEVEQASSYHATPVGQHAIPAMREDEDNVSSVQPVHLRDISDSILRDKTGSESGNNRLQSDELTRMEEVANKQYTEMQQIKEGIQEMVKILRPSSEPVKSGVDDDPRTSFARKHVNPSIYGQMRDGKPGSGPNRSAYKK